MTDYRKFPSIFDFLTSENGTLLSDLLLRSPYVDGFGFNSSRFLFTFIFNRFTSLNKREQRVFKKMLLVASNQNFL